MLNWEIYRNIFPVVNEKTYFMTAGAGAIPLPVLNAITSRYEQVVKRGGAAFGENLAIMETCREKLAKLINAEKENIAFIPNVSYGMNILAHSMPSEGNFLIPENEFPSSILPWENTTKTIKKISPYQDLQANVTKILRGKQVGSSSLITSIVNYMDGYRLNLNDLVDYIQNLNFTIYNGTQAIGVFPIDVKKQKISALVCSCYKWMCCGEGISFLYINPNLFKALKPAFVGWRSIQNSLNFDNTRHFFNDARVFELGWDNMISFAGFNAALDLIAEIGIENISQRVTYLTSKLIELLIDSKIPIITGINVDHFSGIILIGPFKEPNIIAELLQKENIWVNPRRNGIRVSLHFYNNIQDVHKLVHALAKIIGQKIPAHTN